MIRRTHIGDIITTRIPAVERLNAGERTEQSGLSERRLGGYAGRCPRLERAYRQHDGGMVFLKVDPLLANVRGQPRYQTLMRKMQLNA
jgi:hypothetical protein